LKNPIKNGIDNNSSTIYSIVRRINIPVFIFCSREIFSFFTPLHIQIRLGNCYFASDKSPLAISGLYNWLFKSAKVYTSEDLKPHPKGVIGFKSLLVT
jgi:hypothetical protein